MESRGDKGAKREMPLKLTWNNSHTKQSNPTFLGRWMKWLGLEWPFSRSNSRHSKVQPGLITLHANERCPRRDWHIFSRAVCFLVNEDGKSQRHLSLSSSNRASIHNVSTKMPWMGTQVDGWMVFESLIEIPAYSDKAKKLSNCCWHRGELAEVITIKSSDMWETKKKENFERRVWCKAKENCSNNALMISNWVLPQRGEMGNLKTKFKPLIQWQSSWGSF